MRRRFFKNSAYQFVTLLSRRGLIAVLLILVAREGGVAFLGRYSLCFALMYVFNQLAGFGTTMICIRQVARQKDRAKEFMSAVFGTRMTLSALGTLAVILSAPLLSPDPETQKAIYVFCWAIIPLNLADLAQAIFTAYERMEFSAYLSVLQWGTTTTFTYIVLRHGFGIAGVMAVQVICLWVAAALGMWWAVTKFLPLSLSHSFRGWGPVLRESYPLGLCAFFAILYARMGTFQLSALRGAEALGFFAPAAHWNDAAQFIPVTMGYVLLPIMSRNFQGRSSDSEFVLKVSHKYLLIMAGGAALFTFALAREGVTLILGSNFLRAVPVVQVGVWAALPIFLNCNLQTYFVAANRQDIVMWNAGVITVLSLFIYFLLIGQYGPAGAAGAIVACESILFCFSCAWGRRMVHLGSFARASVLPAFALIVGVGTMFASDSVFHFPGHRLAGVAVYLAVLMGSGVLRSSEIAIFEGRDASSVPSEVAAEVALPNSNRLDNDKG